MQRHSVQRNSARRRSVRVTAATTVVLALGAGGALLGATTAEAAGPAIVLPSCATTVQGQPGQPVTLSQSAVVGPVTNVVRGIPLLGAPAADTVANTMNSWGPIPLGSVPGSGSIDISGVQIGNLVVNEINGIPVLGPFLGLVDSGVRNSLGGMCNVVVNAVAPLAPPPPVQPAPAAPAAHPGATGGGGGGAAAAAPDQTYGGPGAPGAASAADTVPPDMRAQTEPDGPYLDTVPAYDYASLAGGFLAPSVDYGSLPDSTDAPSGGDPNGTGGAGRSPNDVAGPANVLDANITQGLELPVALAVLALGGVTAGLVRSFVLRRAAH